MKRMLMPGTRPTLEYFKQQGCSAHHCFFFSSLIVTVAASHGTSLSTSTVSSAAVWLYCTLKCTKFHTKGAIPSRRITWTAGALLALVQLCQEVAGGRGNRWSQALTPWLVIVANIVVLRSPPACASNDIGFRGRFDWQWGVWLCLASVLSLYILGQDYITPTGIVVGLCESLATVVAVTLVEDVFRPRNTTPSLSGELKLLEPGGQLLAQSTARSDDAVMHCIRDLAASLTLICGVLALAFEQSWRVKGYWQVHTSTAMILCLARSMSLFCGMQILALRSSLHFSMLTVGASVASSVFKQLPSMILLSCASLHLLSIRYVLILLHKTPMPNSSHQERWMLMMLPLTLFGMLVVFAFAGHNNNQPDRLWPAIPALSDIATKASSSIHPIKQLVSMAEGSFEKLQTSQSNSLIQAVSEYRGRYKIPPPPGFDAWYRFARKNDVVIYDDYDTVHSAIRPFWALKPAKLRARVREAIGYGGNALIVLMIRRGRIANLSGGLPWQREAITGMVANYVELLPDLDVAFNAHDEPRIVVPHDELSRMIQAATKGSMRDAYGNDSVVNSFSRRPSDMGEGLVIEDHKASKFNEYAHQNTWVPSCLSCPPDSPARDIDGEGSDRVEAFGLGSLGFVYNQTASTDICNIPSLQGQHAFFDRPNAFNVAHHLIPIFSESKVSSFQDIPYPSLWHWYGALFTNSTQDMHLHNTPMYVAADDPSWSNKRNSLYWRGSTTGGFSKDGGWRRHHRQRMVGLLNAHDEATILVNNGNMSTESWQPMITPRAKHAHLFDVALSGVGQCEPADCHAQEEFFQIMPHAPFNATWQHKHVFDIDGNAFSARFYALLHSRSLVYKAAVFREWHDEWLVPWLHYIPISIGGGEALETVRFFAEGEGTEVAERLADVGRNWANKVLRRVDMEAWMFRCLLEYARVMDDNRTGIGYIGG